MELTIKGIAFAATLFILIRGIMKLPKTIAITFSVFVVISVIVITYLCIYHFDMMNSLLSYVSQNANEG